MSTLSVGSWDGEVDDWPFALIYRDQENDVADTYADGRIVVTCFELINIIEFIVLIAIVLLCCLKLVLSCIGDELMNAVIASFSSSALFKQSF